MNPSARAKRNKRLKNMTLKELKGLLKLVQAEIKYKEARDKRFE